MKPGDDVFLSNSQAIQKFGEGPFKIINIHRASNAVELTGIGSIDLKDIKQDVNQKLFANNPSVPDLDLPDEDIALRIESIVGSLLTHPDANVKLAMREILSLLWGD